MGNQACCQEEVRAPEISREKIQYIQLNPNNKKQDHNKASFTNNSNLHPIYEEDPQNSILKSQGQNSKQSQDSFILKNKSNQKNLKESLQGNQLIKLSQQLKSNTIHQNQSHISKQSIQANNIPKLSTEIKKTLAQKNFFSQQFNFKPYFRKYDNDYYEGQLDNNQNFPHGLGKFYKTDGSLYVGHFMNGRAEGLGAFIFKDGSYYHGEFHNNSAESNNGTYKSKQLEYTGEFKNNLFHGKGKELGAAHVYIGSYYTGYRTQGELKWTVNDQQYIYDGFFNLNNQFHGEGQLTEPNGIYKGDFMNGKKHGQGIYKFNNGLRYEGEYRNGVRSGNGIIYNPNNQKAYEGEWDNGLPHGNGYVLGKDGKKLSTSWIQGIDSQLI